MDPSGDHVSDWFASPLWCHVANTLYGNEVKAVILFDESRDLTVSGPWFPCFLNWPVELLDPFLGTVSWNGTIGVSRVEHDLVLVSEDWVDPVRSFSLAVIAKSLRAFFPGLS